MPTYSTTPVAEPEVDDVADAELVLGDDEDAVEHVLDDVLRAEAEAGAERGRDEGEARRWRSGASTVTIRAPRRSTIDRRDDALQDAAERARALHECARRRAASLERLGVVDVLLLLDAVDDPVHDPPDDELQDPAR